jgi:hypothetical protein
MTHLKTKKWLPLLQKTVHSYNNTIHSITKVAPAEVSAENHLKVWNNIYGNWFYSSRPSYPKYAVGDYVRILLNKETFSKQADMTFSPEVFRIASVGNTSPVTYSLEDLQGEAVTGSFYEPELTRVDETTVKERRVDVARKLPKTDKYKVSYTGWPNKFSDIVSKRHLAHLRKPFNAIVKNDH